MSYTNLKGGLGYEGKVTLTLKSNGRILDSKTYKNNGTAQLFKFLGYCLIGNYEKVKGLLPNKILLLNNMSGDKPALASPTNVEFVTEWQYLKQIPTIISDSDRGEVRVIYNFEVSKASITDSFNQIALYGSGLNYDEITNFSAYHYLVNSSESFENINAKEWSATTVLLIEWELTISNKNIEY